MPDKKKILVIDDAPHIQEPLRELLAGEGYEVFSAYEAKEGLDMASRVAPDLVILDVMLPTGSGLNVYDDLKRAIPSHACILVYSSAPTSLVEEKDPALDPSNIISKGMDVDELLALIRKRLS